MLHISSVIWILYAFSLSYTSPLRSSAVSCLWSLDLGERLKPKARPVLSFPEVHLFSLCQLWFMVFLIPQGFCNMKPGLYHQWYETSLHCAIFVNNCWKLSCPVSLLGTQHIISLKNVLFLTHIQWMTHVFRPDVDGSDPVMWSFTLCVSSYSDFCSSG